MMMNGGKKSSKENHAGGSESNLNGGIPTINERLGKKKIYSYFII